MADSKFNMVGIVALLGSILMVVGVFLVWGVLDIPNISTYEISGWELSTFESDGSLVGELKEEFISEVKYAFVPLAVLILGALSLIFDIVPTVTNGHGKAFAALSMLMAIVAIIMAILFYSDVTAIETIGSYKIMETSVGLGFWLSLVGSLIVAIGSVFSLAKQH